jgi:putative DNA primase/helicase
MVDGCREWQRRRGLDAPGAVTAATRSYRNEMDQVGEFVADCCVRGADGVRAGATELFTAYKTWCSLNGRDAMTQTAFGRKLGEKGFASDRETAGPEKGRKFWRGIGMKASDQSEAALNGEQW